MFARVFRIVTAIAALSFTHPASAIDNYQGLWWAAPAASESGWGISFAHQGDTIFATWYTYDASGKGLWLAFIATQSAAGPFTGSIYRTRGPAFNAVPFNSSAVVVTEAGRGTLTFTDAGRGTFAYTLDGITQSKAITRQVFAGLPTCVFGLQGAATASNFQDLWWADPAGSESGWGMSFAHQGDILFATWYTYDVDGTQMWLVATAPRILEGTYLGDLYRTTGPPFSSVPFPPADVRLTKVGTLAVAFDNGTHGTIAYSVNGISQSKAITRQIFRDPGTFCGYAEGLWTGTTSRGEAATAIVLEGGNYFVFYARPDGSGDAAVVASFFRMDAGTLQSDGVSYPIATGDGGGGTATPVAITGSFSPRTQLQLSLDSRTLAATPAANAYQPPSPASLAGTYSGFSGHLSGRRNVTVTIDAGGNLNGVNDLCTFHGRVTPRKSLRLYDIGLNSVAGDCIFGLVASGVLYYDDATRTLRIFSNFLPGQDLFYVIVSR
jgi:hypothetical protein